MYRPLAADVEALLWDGGNRRAVIRFLGDAWRGFSGQWSPTGPDERKVAVRLSGTLLNVPAGNWLVRDANGSLSVWTDQYLHSRYEEVSDG